MRQDGVRCRRGIARYTTKSANPWRDERAEYCRQKEKQVNDAGNPRPGRGDTSAFRSVRAVILSEFILFYYLVEVDMWVSLPRDSYGRGYICGV